MSVINIIQAVISVALIALILMQERSAGSSGLLGGGVDGGFYQARRGLEKIIFIATLVLIAIFAALSLINLVS